MFTLQTEHAIAIDSPDHTDLILVEGELVQEGGTRLNCSRNSNFNRMLYEILKERGVQVPYYITDWGCAGGCFIEDCIKEGNNACGLEGSDYSLKKKRESWGRFPESFFTCDITHDFQILYNGNPCKFDVITSWECLEHLVTDRVPILWNNVKKHLKEGGLFIGSISHSDNSRNHLTLKPESWWQQQWDRVGLSKDSNLQDRFKNQFIRGPDQNAPASFNVVLK